MARTDFLCTSDYSRTLCPHFSVSPLPADSLLFPASLSFFLLPLSLLSLPSFPPIFSLYLP